MSNDLFFRRKTADARDSLNAYIVFENEESLPAALKLLVNALQSFGV